MQGDLYHVFNRGVDKRKIFIDDKDYMRFVNNLFLLNNKGGKIRTKKKDFFNDVDIKRDKLVEILRWSLLPNHYHLLLYEVRDGGVVEFTKRLGNAYTKYFNTKNKNRSGYLFQNSAKIVLVDNNRQFLYIPFYIDLNPLDLYPDYHKNIVNNKSINFLKQYKWSSLGNTSGDRNFCQVINTDLFFDLFDTNQKEYEIELINYLKEEGVNLAG